VIPLHVTFEEACRDLQKPGGEDPRFSTITTIAEHRCDFVRAAHETWKRWHAEAVHQILVFDAFAKAEQARPIGTPAKEFSDFQRALWRRVNDAIVWSVCGSKRHVVKRLCLYRPRTFLAESNAAMAMSVISQLNANPLSLAVWTDATSCVDIGDVLWIPDGLRPNPEFLELKEGPVNEAILDMVALQGAELETRLGEFHSKYGERGFKQIQRIVRQKQVSDQVLDLLRDERGIDPVSGSEIEIVDVGVQPEFYDDSLNALLCAALESRGEVIELVAECLWVYANADPSASRLSAEHRFEKFLAEKLPRAYCRGRPARREPTDRDRIASLLLSFDQPIAKPLFLRELDPHLVGSAIAGELAFKIFVYLDVERFAALIDSSGATWRWGTDKELRRSVSSPSALRPVTFSGKLPVIHVGECRTSITDPAMVQMLFDGVTPRTIARALVAHGKRMQARAQGYDSGEGAPK
jgi:hypothetical protein